MWLGDLEQALKDIKALGLFPCGAVFEQVLPATDGIIFANDNGNRLKWFSKTGRIIQYRSSDWRTGAQPYYDSAR